MVWRGGLFYYLTSCKARASLSHSCTLCTVPCLSPANWSWISSLRCVYRRQTCRRGWDQCLAAGLCAPSRRTSLCGTRSAIGPARRPISSRRGLRKTPPRTRAVCTQESKAGQSCCAKRRRTMTSWAVLPRIRRAARETKRWPLAPRATHLWRGERTRYRVKGMFFALTKSCFSHSRSPSLIPSVGALMPRLFHNKKFMSSLQYFEWHFFSQDNWRYCLVFWRDILWFLVCIFFKHPRWGVCSPSLFEQLLFCRRNNEFLSLVF